MFNNKWLIIRRYTIKRTVLMYHIKQTHNLEVPGSSPGWSTKEEALIAQNQQLTFFLFVLFRES